MMWRDSFVAIDTETTGFGTSARVLEVACVTFEGGEPVREWSSLLYPTGVNWEDEKVKQALAVNRLTREMLEGKPSFHDVLPDLLVELAHPVWVAHNAEFDAKMLQQELQRLCGPGELAAPLKPGLLICTKNLASALNGGASGNKLEQVVERFGVKLNGAHRAVADAKACGLVLAAMSKGGHLPAEDAAMVEFCRKADAQWKRKFR